jgi:Tfp pilus assembly protein PilF
MQRSSFFWARLFLLALGIFCIYSSSFYYSFTNYDDDLLILENTKLHHFSLEHLRRIAWGFEDIAYQPLQDFSFLLDYTFWGALHPEGFRLTNFLLYFLNGLVFFYLARSLLKKESLALGATLLFLVHPSHVESVVWISGRKDLLAFLCGGLCLLCWTRPEKKGRILALFFYLCALGSKPNMVTLPVLAWLYFRYRGQKRGLEVLASFVLTLPAVYLFLKVAEQQRVFVEFHGGSPYATFLTMLALYKDYLALWIWPCDLTHFYVVPLYQVWNSASLLGLVLLGISLFLTFWGIQKNHWIGWAMGWFLVSLLPYANIFPISILFADRYLYWASVPFFIVLFFPFRSTPPHRAIFFLPLVFLWGVLSFQQTLHWKDSISLWQRAQTFAPESDQIAVSLGAAYLQKATQSSSLEERIHCWNQAKQAFHSVLRFPSSHPRQKLRAYFNLGVLACTQQEVEDAYHFFEKAEKIINDFEKEYQGQDSLLQDLKKIRSNIFRSKGDLYIQAQDFSQALTCYQKAIQLAPQDPQPRVTLASLLTRLDRDAEAWGHLEEALTSHPYFIPALLQKGLLLLSQKIEEPAQAALRDQRAKALFEKILQEDPQHIEAHFYYAMAIQPVSPSQFEAHLQEVVRLDPEHIEAHRYLLRFYLQRAQYAPEQEIHWVQALPHLNFFRGKTDEASKQEVIHYILIAATQKIQKAEQLTQENQGKGDSPPIQDLWQKAQLLYEAILQLKPQEKEAVLGAFKCAYTLENYDFALKYLNILSQHYPQETKILLLQGNTYEKKKELFQALYFYEKFQETLALPDPKLREKIKELEEQLQSDLKRFYELAVKALQEGDRKTAQNCLQEGLTRNPSDPGLNYVRARLAHLEKNWAEEFKALELALNAPLPPPTLYYEFALAALKQEKPDIARWAFLKFKEKVSPEEAQKALVEVYLEEAQKSVRVQGKEIEIELDALWEGLQQEKTPLSEERLTFFLQQTKKSCQRLPHCSYYALKFAYRLILEGDTELALRLLKTFDRQKTPCVAALQALFYLNNPQEKRVELAIFHLLEFQKTKSFESQQEWNALISALQGKEQVPFGTVFQELRHKVEQEVLSLLP